MNTPRPARPHVLRAMEKNSGLSRVKHKVRYAISRGWFTTQSCTALAPAANLATGRQRKIMLLIVKHAAN